MLLLFLGSSSISCRFSSRQYDRVASIILDMVEEWQLLMLSRVYVHALISLQWNHFAMQSQ